MRIVPIATIRITQDKKLMVFPDVSEEDKYSHIYRDATGIRWDSENGFLYFYETNNFSFELCFETILNAVAREYGDRLVLNEHTRWKNVSELTREKFESKALWNTD